MNRETDLAFGGSKINCRRSRKGTFVKANHCHLFFSFILHASSVCVYCVTIFFGGWRRRQRKNERRMWGQKVSFHHVFTGFEREKGRGINKDFFQIEFMQQHSINQLYYFQKKKRKTLLFSLLSLYIVYTESSKLQLEDVRRDFRRKLYSVKTMKIQYVIFPFY